MNPRQNATPANEEGPGTSRALLRQRLVQVLGEWYGPRATVRAQVPLRLGSQLILPDVTVHSEDAGLRPMGYVAATGMPVLAVIILDAAAPFGPQVAATRQLLLAGLTSCWLIEPTLRTVTISTAPGSYQSFNRHETLRDPATGIELEVERLLR